jgi:sulfite exporter TauE/SafE
MAFSTNDKSLFRNASMLAILAGGAAGLIHVLSGPDHLAAVAPISLQSREQSWKTGFRWGLGHAGGVVLVGVLSLLLREMLPISILSSIAERLVGVALIAIGLWGFRRMWKLHVHVHTHTDDASVHAHIHAHGHAHEHQEPKPHTHTHAAIAVGTLHGFAGSSHFLGVLPALAFSSRFEAVAYLGSFGAGTVLAMTLFSLAIGHLAKGFSIRGTLAYRSLMGLCSIAALAVGSYWLLTQ